MRAVQVLVGALAVAASPFCLPAGPVSAAATTHVEDAAWYWSVIDTTGTGLAGTLSGVSGVPAGDVAVGYTNAPDKASALQFSADSLALGQDPDRIRTFVAEFALDPAATQVAPATTPVLACPLLARVVGSPNAQPLASLPEHGNRCTTGAWSADKTKVAFDLRSAAAGWVAGDALPGLVLVVPGTVTTPTQDVFLREPALRITLAPAASGAAPSGAAAPASTPTPEATPVTSQPAPVPLPATGPVPGSEPAQPAPAVATPQASQGVPEDQPRASSAAVARPFSRTALVLAGIFGALLLACCGLGWPAKALAIPGLRG